jgi:shikimate kinase
LDQHINTHTHDDDANERIRRGNILLTGISASGKSTVGRQLAKLLGLGFIDLDEVIEKVTRKTISEIFDSQGEPAFRELELQTLTTLQGLRSHVLAVGGGALLSPEAIKIAKKIGPLVWVQSSPAEIARRLFKRVSEIEKRPLFRDLLSEENNSIRKDLIQSRVQKMMDERRPWFERADVVLDGSYVTPEMAAQHLKDILLGEGLIPLEHARFSSWQAGGGN